MENSGDDSFDEIIHQLSLEKTSQNGNASSSSSVRGETSGHEPSGSQLSFGPNLLSSSPVRLDTIDLTGEFKGLNLDTTIVISDDDDEEAEAPIQTRMSMSLNNLAQPLVDYSSSSSSGDDINEVDDNAASGFTPAQASTSSPALLPKSPEASPPPSPIVRPTTSRVTRSSQRGGRHRRSRSMGIARGIDAQGIRDRVKVSLRLLREANEMAHPYVRQTRERHVPYNILLEEGLDAELLAILGRQRFEEFAVYVDYGLINGFICYECKDIFHSSRKFAAHILKKHMELHGTIEQVLDAVANKWIGGRRHNYCCELCPANADREYTNKKLFMEHIKDDHLVQTVDKKAKICQEPLDFILESLGWEHADLD